MAERSPTARKPRGGSASSTRSKRAKPTPPPTRVRASFRQATDLGVLERYMRGLDDDPVTGVSDPYTKLLTIFRGVNIVATSLARVPFEIWDTVRDEPLLGVDGDDPRSRLVRLTKRPSAAMTWRKLIETLIVHYHSGNAYLYPYAQDVYGVPQELRLLQPTRIRPYREPGDDPMTIRGWEYRRPGDGNTAILPVAKVMRLEYAVNQEDPFIGIGPFGPGRMATDSEYLAGTYQRATLANGGAPGQILSFDGDEDELPREQADKLESEWQKKFGGASQGNKLALLTGKWTYQVLGFRPRDMEFLAQRKFSLDEFARLLNLPPLYLGVFENAGLSDAGLRVQQRLLYENNTIPLAVKVAELLNEFLIQRVDPTLEGVFNFDTVEALRDDLTSKATVAVQLVSAGWSREQVDERLDLGFDYEAEHALEAAMEAQSATTGPAAAIGAAPVALSGLQITAIMDVVKAVVAGEIPRDSAVGILEAGLGMSREDATAVIGSAGTPKELVANPTPEPEPEPAPPPVPVPPPVEDGAQPAREDQKDGDVGEPPPQFDRRSPGLRSVRAAAPRRKPLSASQIRKAKRAALKQAQSIEHTIENKIRSTIMSWRAGVLRRLVKLNAASGGSGARAVLRAESDLAEIRLTAEQIAVLLDEIDASSLRRAITPGIRQAYRAGTATLGDVMDSIGVPIENYTRFQDDRLPALVNGYIDKRLGTGLPTAVTDATRDAVNSVIVSAVDTGANLKQTIDGIRDVFDASLSRARTIARTETAIAMSSSRQIAYMEQGVEKHQWLTAGDEHVRDEHAELDGVIAEVGEEFLPGLRYPSDPDCPDPSLVINCRCTTVPLSRTAYAEQRDEGAQTASELALEHAQEALDEAEEA